VDNKNYCEYSTTINVYLHVTTEFHNHCTETHWRQVSTLSNHQEILKQAGGCDAADKFTYLLCADKDYLSWITSTARQNSQQLIPVSDVKAKDLHHELMAMN